MNAISDTVPTLAVVALFADGPTTIRNVAHIRDKETDRIGDLTCELRRLGGTVVEHADGLTIAPVAHAGAESPGQGGGGLHGATVETYDDHRMAMSLPWWGCACRGFSLPIRPALARHFLTTGTVWMPSLGRDSQHGRRAFDQFVHD
jgi:3-phosphoshikimate 1-carboxyvinyltransferase